MPTVKILHSFACAGAMVLSGCATTLLPSLDDIANGQAYSVAPPDAPSGAAVDAFARTFLNEIQPASILNRAEYCGYFFLDANGQLQGTPPIRGQFASCEMLAPQPGQGIIASYHTHGSHSVHFDDEVPSVIDLESDFIFGIDGYVSTPGGRVWLVDFQTLSTSQVCGTGCVFNDPTYEPDESDTILPSYSLQALRDRQRLF